MSAEAMGKELGREQSGTGRDAAHASSQAPVSHEPKSAHETRAASEGHVDRQGEDGLYDLSMGKMRDEIGDAKVTSRSEERTRLREAVTNSSMWKQDPRL